MTAETTPDTAAPETPAATLAGRTRPGPDGPSAGESSAGVLRPPSGSSFAGAEVFVGALVLFGALAWLNIASLRTLEHSPRAAGPFLLVFGGLATMAVLRLRRHGGGAMAILAALGLALLGRLELPRAAFGVDVASAGTRVAVTAGDATIRVLEVPKRAASVEVD